MTVYHINDNDEAKRCQAHAPENCKFYRGEEDTRHHDSFQSAVEASEKLLKAQHGETTSSTKKKVRYSFLKEFKEQDKQFTEDFEGVPKRFFSTDLRGKWLHEGYDLDAAIAQHEGSDSEVRVAPISIYKMREVTGHTLHAMSSPADNRLSDEEVQDLADDLGAHHVEKLDPHVIRSMHKGTERAWKLEYKDTDAEGNERTKYVIAADKPHKKMGAYRFRRRPDALSESSSFVLTDVRSLAGASRIQKKTGYNTIRDSVASDVPGDPYKVSRMMRSLQSLEDAQREGNNFMAQKKYIRENSGNKVATVWMDKKNPDAVRQDMMDNTALKGDFRHVEIDNDVDPVEYADFERSYQDAKEKLPPIPDGKEPELRIRKLGKHNATGLFSPGHNTIAVDVRTSGSFVHEYGHYCDTVVQNNASLRGDFRQITQKYSRDLDIPAEVGEQKREYYTTPTEIFARGFELYSQKRLGITENRLLDEDKLENFDYEPFQKDPEFRERTFEFFDKVFEQQKAEKQSHA